MGDQLDQARPVDHVALFKNWRSAKKAAADLESFGFVVSQTRSGLKQSLGATRSETLTDENVATFVELIIHTVASRGGSYDGFGGSVVQASA